MSDRLAGLRGLWVAGWQTAIPGLPDAARRPDAVVVEAAPAGVAGHDPAGRIGQARRLARTGVVFLHLEAGDPDRFDADLDWAMPGRPDGVLLPWAGAVGLGRWGNRLAVAEARAGLPDGALAVLGVAGPAGLLSGPAGPTPPRLAGLCWHAPALEIALGAEPGLLTTDGPGSGHGSLAMLTRLAAAAAGVPALAWIGGPPDAAPGIAREAKRLGFMGALGDDLETIVVFQQRFGPET